MDLFFLLSIINLEKELVEYSESSVAWLFAYAQCNETLLSVFKRCGHDDVPPSCHLVILFTLNGNGNGTQQVQGTGMELMGTNILYRNVHTSPRQG